MQLGPGAGACFCQKHQCSRFKCGQNFSSGVQQHPGLSLQNIHNHGLLHRSLPQQAAQSSDTAGRLQVTIFTHIWTNMVSHLSWHLSFHPFGPCYGKFVTTTPCCKHRNSHRFWIQMPLVFKYVFPWPCLDLSSPLKQYALRLENHTWMQSQFSPFPNGHMAYGGGDVILLWEVAPIFFNADPNFFLSLELEQNMGVMAKQSCSHPLPSRSLKRGC